MLEKWKNVAGNRKVFGARPTDLSKAFDCICHDLLIAKLNAFCVSLSVLKQHVFYKKTIFLPEAQFS